MIYYLIIGFAVSSIIMAIGSMEHVEPILVLIMFLLGMVAWPAILVIAWVEFLKRVQ